MARQRNRRGEVRGWRRYLVLGGMAVAMGSCFSPHNPPCAFTCITTPDCPDGYACGPDGLCHRNGDTDTCDLQSPRDGGLAGAAGGGAAGAVGRAAGGAGGSS